MRADHAARPVPSSSSASSPPARGTEHTPEGTLDRLPDDYQEPDEALPTGTDFRLYVIDTWQRRDGSQR